MKVFKIALGIAAALIVLALILTSMPTSTNAGGDSDPCTFPITTKDQLTACVVKMFPQLANPPVPKTTDDGGNPMGSGFCVSNGTNYPVSANSTAVWNDEKSLKAMTTYGAHCEVTTVKNGFLWSVAFGTITLDGKPFDRGMAMKAAAGKYVFDYDAPKSGTTNDSIGLKFRTDMPTVAEGQKPLATDATCKINDVTYALSVDATAVWQDGELLKKLTEFGGHCELTSQKPGWYWSVQGTVTLNGTKMANGSRLVAPAGKWIFEYPKPDGKNENYGFVVRDNVPYN